MQLLTNLSSWIRSTLRGADSSTSGTSTTACDDINGANPQKEGGEDGEDTAVTGSCLEVKRVDEFYDPERREWTSRDSVVPERKDTKEKDKYNRFAFTVVRKFEKRSDPADFLYTTILDIKSPQLKKACEHVIGDVQGISWTFNPLRLNPQMVMAFLPDFVAYVAALRDKEDKSDDDAIMTAHLGFFIDYIQAEHASTLSSLRNLLAHDEITFDLLWALLVPRTIMHTKCRVTGASRAVRVTHAERGTTCNGVPCWEVQGEYVEYNERCHAEKASRDTPKFGFAPAPTLTILIFSGAVKISSLPHYPLRYHPNVDELKVSLVERGRKWCSLQGVHHRHFKGTTVNQYTGKYNIESRVMIDWKTFTEINPNYSLPGVVKSLDGSDLEKHKAKYSEVDENDASTETAMSDDHLLLASPILYGFSLSDKLWLELNVENVFEFEWSNEPFENLVLPPAQKTLVRSLVETHSKDSTGFDDFVKGKGRGLIINLFGNPGVGKSLTAEATSEHVRKPLYVVGAGDLGITASALDDNLTQIFNISSSWGAVVLIDEADVFLEERSVHDLQRNAVVAVFLRQLEYFQGILFLTTNRVKTFDEAFQSRIHVSLRYHDLTPDARRTIWVAFLKKAGGARASASSYGKGTLETIVDTVTDLELQDLSARAVNGRQIKNVVKTASALAAASGARLSYAHLVQVLDMMAQFEVDRKEMPR